MEKKKVIKEDYVIIQKLAEEYFAGEEIKGIDRLGGMTNHTYCVEFPLKKYVFRLPGEGTEKMINRQDEKVSTELACQLGIDAPLIMFDEKNGVKIAEYLENSKTMSPEELQKPDHIKEVAELLRKLHSCGKDTGVPFDVFGMSEEYEKLIRSYHIPMFDNYEIIREKVLNIREKMQGYKMLVPCHNDPLCENWVRTEDRMYLIDWEYAGMNEGMWDVADVAIEAHMDEEKSELLLETYLGHKADQGEKMNFIANKIYLDFLWSLWGKTRVPFDGQMMREYALERYERMQKNMELYDAYYK